MPPLFDIIYCTIFPFLAPYCEYVKDNYKVNIAKGPVTVFQVNWVRVEKKMKITSFRILEFHISNKT